MLARAAMSATLATSLNNERQEKFRQRLATLGFDDVRFATVSTPIADTAPEFAGLSAWLAGGMHGEMQWMERTAEKRMNPALVLPGVRSVVMLGVNYWSKTLRSLDARGGPIWARYALHEDYHDTMKPALVAAGRALEEIYGVAADDYRYYVDTGPVLERGWAARAGIGFVGKNAMLISRKHGNWLFIAAILTRIDFVPDDPIRKTVSRLAPDVDGAAKAASTVGLLCGKCSRCLDACPTNAFVQPGVVDARRCISYQTIENKGVIPRELRPGIGQRIYGCDVCLEICPWNRFAHEGRQLLLSARYDLAELSLHEILALTPTRFAEVFRRTPIKRLKLIGLLRNACVVAGNSGDTTLLPPLVQLAVTHESPLVRAHAVWAVYRLGGDAQLTDARAAEAEAIVLAEYAAEDAVS
jgi:epoxyqueuosine reductase